MLQGQIFVSTPINDIIFSPLEVIHHSFENGHLALNCSIKDSSRRLFLSKENFHPILSYIHVHVVPSIERIPLENETLSPIQFVKYLSGHPRGVLTSLCLGGDKEKIH